MKVKLAPKRQTRKDASVPILPSTIPNRPKVPGEPHLVGYARVSMSDQSNQRQVDDLVRYGVADVDIFSDKMTGRTMDRPGWRLCWQDLRSGDVLVVHSLDRLGRNLEEIIRVERELRERGCTLKSLKEDLNTSTPTGKLMFHFIAAMAEWERAWGRERTMNGLARARDRGKMGGRKQVFSDEQIETAVQRYGTNGAATELGCNRVTVIRRMARLEERRRDQSNIEKTATAYPC